MASVVSGNSIGCEYFADNHTTVVGWLSNL